MIIQSRRSFLVGTAASLLAAPAIVRASSLMPVKAIKPVGWEELVQWGIDSTSQSEETIVLLVQRIRDADIVMKKYMTQSLYGDVA
jgi:hypothetical protein